MMRFHVAFQIAAVEVKTELRIQLAPNPVDRNERTFLGEHTLPHHFEVEPTT